MLRTLLLIPHEIAGVPVFGVGWVLLLLVLGVIGRLAWIIKQKSSIKEFVQGESVMWLVMALIVGVLLPFVEVKNMQGDPVGMAIRGYGVMLMVAITASVMLAMHRTRKRGMNPDVIYSMVMWVVIGGIGGARLFYVIQYRDQFAWDSPLQAIRNLLSFTEGGLVVYGSLIGGFLGGCIFVWRNKLPLLRLGDAIIPCILLGIFFGRIGCLMNGCCYGGRCEDGWSALKFPPRSPVYQDQIMSGELLGLSVDPESKIIKNVAADSPAELAGIKPGARVEKLSQMEPPLEEAPIDVPFEDLRLHTLLRLDSGQFLFTPDMVPSRALPVRPAQLISSISALLLCLLLCSLRFKRPGVVMIVSFASYAILRFVLEMVRVDEAGQFGTGLSISQLVSIAVLVCCSCGLLWLYRKSEPI